MTEEQILNLLSNGYILEKSCDIFPVYSIQGEIISKEIFKSLLEQDKIKLSNYCSCHGEQFVIN